MPKQPSQTKTASPRLTYVILTYLITLLPMAWFSGVEFSEAHLGAGLISYVILAWLGLTGLQLLPGWLMLSFARPPAKLWTRRIAWTLAGLWTGLLWLFLISDAAVHARFGFHFNGLVFNLLTTRGGFESMGLDIWTIIGASIAGLLLLAGHLWLAYAAACSPRFPRFTGRRIAWGLLLPGTALAAALLFTGVAEFYRDMVILNAIDAYPVNIDIRMRKIMKRLGFTAPPRNPADASIERAGSELNYPEKPIVRRADRPRYNLLWITAESFRADLFSPERTPRLWQFAEKNAVYFTNHYSGGNGTRPGMFSLFYGLYASAWKPFLNHNRGPLVIDWLLEDNAQMLVQTSARFTYPEFDQTVFAAIPKESLFEQEGKPIWQRDVDTTDRLLEFLANRDPERPFFGFLFFESSHAPYTFPEENAPFQPCLEDLSYTTISVEERELVYNRAANAAYHIDGQVARLLDFLEENGLLQNTIVIFTGDHGEEFYEHGRLGHNSAFVDEQIKPALIMHLPGVPAQRYDGMSHHTDVVPTLAPFFGVDNSPADYSVGGNLLDRSYQRRDFLVCGWDTAVFVNANGKLMLPLNTKSINFRNRLLDENDLPSDDIELFYEENLKDIVEVQDEMRRCFDD